MRSWKCKQLVKSGSGKVALGHELSLSKVMQKSFSETTRSLLCATGLSLQPYAPRMAQSCTAFWAIDLVSAQG